MSEVRIARLACLLAVLAGVVLSVWAWLDNLQPVGCIGDGCDTHPMRTTPTTAVIVGLLLVALPLLRSRVLPTWVIALLAAGVLVMVFTHEENWRLLLIVPFSAAWAVAGALLARGDTAAPAGHVGRSSTLTM